MRHVLASAILGMLFVPAGSALGQRPGSLRHQWTNPTHGGLSVYPGAVPAPERNNRTRGRGTVSIENASVSALEAARYDSNDPPAKILAFYRNRMRSFGEVIECSEGRNPRVDVKLDEQSLSDPSSCDPDNLGENETELKVGDEADQHIVAVRAKGTGTEFSLVHVHRR